MVTLRKTATSKTDIYSLNVGMQFIQNQRILTFIFHAVFHWITCRRRLAASKPDFELGATARLALALLLEFELLDITVRNRHVTLELDLDSSQPTPIILS